MRQICFNVSMTVKNASFKFLCALFPNKMHTNLPSNGATTLIFCVMGSNLAGLRQIKQNIKCGACLPAPVSEKKKQNINNNNKQLISIRCKLPN